MTICGQRSSWYLNKDSRTQQLQGICTVICYIYYILLLYEYIWWWIWWYAVYVRILLIYKYLHVSFSMDVVCAKPWLGESQSTSQGDAAALALRLQQLLAEREEAEPERFFLKKHVKMDKLLCALSDCDIKKSSSRMSSRLYFCYFSVLFTFDTSCYCWVGIEPSPQIFPTPIAADAQLQESRTVL